MIYEIPMQTSAFFNISVDLDLEAFSLTFRWNTREEAWYMDLCDIDQTVIAGGIKVLPGIDLTSRFQAVGAPLGALMCIGESESAERPSRTDLGTRVKIYYFDKEEVDALQAA